MKGPWACFSKYKQLEIWREIIFSWLFVELLLEPFKSMKKQDLRFSKNGFLTVCKKKYQKKRGGWLANFLWALYKDKKFWKSFKKSETEANILKVDG